MVELNVDDFITPQSKDKYKYVRLIQDKKVLIKEGDKIVMHFHSFAKPRVIQFVDNYGKQKSFTAYKMNCTKGTDKNEVIYVFDLSERNYSYIQDKLKPKAEDKIEIFSRVYEINIPGKGIFKKLGLNYKLDLGKNTLQSSSRAAGNMTASAKKGYQDEDTNDKIELDELIDND